MPFFSPEKEPTVLFESPFYLKGINTHSIRQEQGKFINELASVDET